MPNQPPTICPLCLKSAAIIGTTNAGKNKVFKCEGCGEFGVSDKAEARIKGLPDQFKNDWRAKIHATKPSELFVITIGPPGSGGQIEEERVPRHTIQSLP